MDNLEKYNETFMEVFGVSADALNGNFSKETVEEWDSVHQLGVVTGLEDAFDIMFDPEDIMACTGYNAGKEILARNGVEL